MSSAREMMANVATALVTVIALGLGVLRAKELITPASRGAKPPHQVAQWRSFIPANRQHGVAAARVTIIEFADFQCPFCARAVPELNDIRRRYPKDVAIIFRHYPLPNHRFAHAAARASECARGLEKFDRLHDVLYAQQDSIGIKHWTHFALDAGILDTVQFSACMADTANAAIKSLIASDVDAGMKLGIDGTPTFLINDMAVEGYAVPGALTARVVGLLRSPAHQ